MSYLRFAYGPCYVVAAAGLVSAVGLLEGCSDRTGVLVEVTRDEATTPAQIKELRFFVGVEVEPGEGMAGDFVDDIDPNEEVVLDPERDLLDDPYRLLLNRGAEDARTLMIAVAGYKDGDMVGFGGLEESVTFLDGKVLQWEVVLRGNRADRVEITQTGCLVWTTEGGTVVIVSPGDLDCDGDPKETDCDDLNPTIGPTKPEICYNEIDDDCDEVIDEEEDVDDDGVTNCEDCDDTDNQRFPGNPEVCDGIDNDCNEVCDDGPLDFDGDDYTVCDRKILPDGSCTDPNESLFDCDDESEITHPGAMEICDGSDNNCNGNCDEGFDPDIDLYTECGSHVEICDSTSAENIDCEPNDKRAYPGNEPERCDGVDNDCDGIYYPESAPCYVLITETEPRCLVGHRPCGDNAGTGWGDCAAEGGAEEVSPDFCEAYELCGDAADPWACANGEVELPVATCQIFYNVEVPGELCLPAWAGLTNSMGSTHCNWAIAPASVTPHYAIGFTAESTTGPVVSAIEQCAPNLVVSDAHNAPPVADSFLVHEEDDNITERIFRLDLVPVGLEECPGDESGLECTNLPPS